MDIVFATAAVTVAISLIYSAVDRRRREQAQALNQMDVRLGPEPPHSQRLPDIRPYALTMTYPIDSEENDIGRI